MINYVERGNISYKLVIVTLTFSNYSEFYSYGLSVAFGALVVKARYKM